MAKARSGKPPTRKSGPKRFSSRPARLPAKKEKVGPDLLEALDVIGESLDTVTTVYDPFPRKRPAGSVRWSTQKGRPGTIWVTNTVYVGTWNYKSLYKALNKPRVKKALPKQQLCFLSYRFEELNDKGQVIHEDWSSVPGGLTVWASAIQSLINLCNPERSDSPAHRYKASVIRELSIQLASQAGLTFVQQEAESEAPKSTAVIAEKVAEKPVTKVAAPVTHVAKEETVKDFANNVIRLMKGLPTLGKFSPKVFIAYVYDALGKPDRADFERKMLQANREGLLSLSRLDLQSLAPSHDIVDRSRIDNPVNGAVYHLVE